MNYKYLWWVGALAACGDKAHDLVDADGDGIFASADCDDSNASAFPGADERCDGVDNDCDGAVDNAALDALTYYRDADGDGFGGPETAAACAPPEGHVLDGTDCDDSDASAFPGADERCDAADRDCDGDPTGGAVDAPAWFADHDGDGFGAGEPTIACAAPEGFIADDTDCDDLDADVHPGAEERCDATDWNCDGEMDSGAVDMDLWYGDADGDGYGDPVAPHYACERPVDASGDDLDCDDTDDTVFPGSWYPETPGDGIDVNCDGEDRCTDWNCDGWPDLLVATNYRNPTGSLESGLWFSGFGNYARTRDAGLWTEKAWDVATADFDRDGFMDAAFANNAAPITNRVDSPLYYGAGAEEIDVGRVAWFPTTGASAVRASDLDGDGWVDLVFANYKDGSDPLLNSQVFWNGPEGFDAARRDDLPTQGAMDVEVADLDGDGFKELVFCSFTDGDYEVTSMIYWGSADGYSAADRADLPMQGCYDAAIADWDGDGLLDLAFASYYTGRSYETTSSVWFGAPSDRHLAYTEANRRALATTGATRVQFAQVTGDPRPELILGSHRDATNYARYVQIYAAEDAREGALDPIFLPASGVMDTAVADFNGDSAPDVMVCNQRDQIGYAVNSTLYWGGSEGPSLEDPLQIPTVGCRRALAQDLDFDGDIDLITASVFNASFDGDWYSRVFWNEWETLNTDLWSPLDTGSAFGITVVGTL